MRIFKRRHPEHGGPFWENPPFRTDDPEVLYQHGIRCVTESDGPGMMAVGWALWDVWGLGQHQAWDFLYDGYAVWVQAGAPSDERISFSTAVFDRLRVIEPQVPPETILASIPPGVAVPASRSYGTRCWAISEVIEVAAQQGGIDPEMEEELFQALLATHRGFMPARTLSDFRALARARGVPVD